MISVMLGKVIKLRYFYIHVPDLPKSACSGLLTNAGSRIRFIIESGRDPKLISDPQSGSRPEPAINLIAEPVCETDQDTDFGT